MKNATIVVLSILVMLLALNVNSVAFAGGDNTARSLSELETEMREIAISFCKFAIMFADDAEARNKAAKELLALVKKHPKLAVANTEAIGVLGMKTKRIDVLVQEIRDFTVSLEFRLKAGKIPAGSDLADISARVREVESTRKEINQLAELLFISSRPLPFGRRSFQLSFNLVFVKIKA